MFSCNRCHGLIAEDVEWDLPSQTREYCCINCGDRFWETSALAITENLQKLYRFPLN